MKEKLIREALGILDTFQKIADSQVGKLALVALTFSVAAFAGGVAMPWNKGLTSLSGNLTGTTALGLVTVGAAGTFGPMIFNGEINHFAQRGANVALVGGALLGIPQLVKWLGVGGALL